MAKKILIVVDMQNDFITGPLGNDDCRNAVKGCVELCEDETFDNIIFTRDTHYANYLDTLEGQKLPVKHCIKDTQGWEIIPELGKFAALAKSKAVNKETFGSMPTNDIFDLSLTDIIRFDMKGEDPTETETELHFCGVCTSICVLANMVIARANWPDVKIVLHTKATGDVTPEMKQAAFICAKAQQCELED